jgi:hypothetical protein
VAKQGGAHDQLSQGPIERVLCVSPVKALIAVAPAGDQMSGLQLGQLILHGLEREMAQARELPHIQLLPWVREQESEHFGSDEREQAVQKRLGHSVDCSIDRFKRSSPKFANQNVRGRFGWQTGVKAS